MRSPYLFRFHLTLSLGSGVDVYVELLSLPGEILRIYIRSVISGNVRDGRVSLRSFKVYKLKVWERRLRII